MSKVTVPLKRVVFMGTPDFAVPTLEALVRAEYQVAGVFTQPDRPKGRSGKPAFSPVKEAALAHGIPVFQPEKIRKGDNAGLLRQLEPDVIVVAAFGQIIPKEILELPPYGCVNVHASLLPKYRGAAPIQWAVINGERESGVTTMQMGEGLDTGDILMKKVCVLEPDETGGSLFDKLKEAGAALLIDTLKGLEAGTVTPEKQPETSPTPYAAMLTKKDGLIDWNKSAAAIERLVRGLDPWPSAYTFLDGKQLKIWKAVPAEESGTDGCEDRTGEALPGSVIAADRGTIRVLTGDGVLEIRELQLEGKKRMETG
ncbi:MAG: methionyl-tRNA formyltransferase, partial [Lachnospiraceae bacterium]|nr:methionyl-tRNA formyltransferase [Lachnospiraceae bacterium]